MKQLVNLIAATPLFVAGCGDDGSSGSGTGSGSGSATSTTSATTADSGSGSQTATTADPVTCEVIDPVDTPTPEGMTDPTVRRTVSGENGEFTDECDADGNLLDYFCETETECGPGPNPSCTSRQTGNVAPEMFDCAGTCSDGTCVARCPAEGDIVEYTSIAGDDVMFLNQSDQRRYDCMLSFDQMTDTYNCSTDPAVGATTVIFGLGLMSTWCTGTQTFNIATGDPQQCTYLCAAIP